MKSFAINPAATTINYTTCFDFSDLENLGWDFDTYYANTAERMAEQKGVHYTEVLEEATKEVQENYNVLVRLKTEGEKIGTYYALNGTQGQGVSDWEWSGDDQQTVKDVIDLLNGDKNYTYRTDDESEDADGNYVHTFVQA